MRKPRRRITQADYRAAGRGLARDSAEDSRRYCMINRYDCRSTLRTIEITARNCSMVCVEYTEIDPEEPS